MQIELAPSVASSVKGHFARRIIQRDETDILALGSPPPDSDPRILGLYAYWRYIAPAPGVLPGRQHFDPIDTPKLLRWIWLADVERDPLAFRYRLTGSEFVIAMGAEFRGRCIGEADPDFLQTPRGQHYIAVAEGQTGYLRGCPVVYPDRNHSYLERLALPLARDGKNVDMLLGLTVYDPINRPLW